MEDSLSDYIKISKNSKHKEVKISKDNVAMVEKQKNECNSRALKIVHMAIEGKLRRELFLRSLPFINQEYYQDIVEERAIVKLCGYPVCAKKIPPMPKKQYFISTKLNKVYDITDRKNFCSNFCYEASLHIKNQIDTSPLWTRKFDKVQEYNLLTSKSSGLPGEEIDQGVIKSTVEPIFTSVSAFTDISLDDMIENEFIPEKPREREVKVNHSKIKEMGSSLKSIQEDDEQSQNVCTKENNIGSSLKAVQNNDVEQSHNVCTKENNVGQSEEAIDSKEKIDGGSNDKINNKEYNKNDYAKGDNFVDNRSDATISSSVNEKRRTKRETLTKTIKNRSAGVKIMIELENHLKKCFKEWFTLETHIYLFGTKTIKEILQEDKLIELLQNLNISEASHNQHLKYLEICRRLNLKEMEDEKYDLKVLGKNELRPLPDYTNLKQETKKLQVKVKSFLGGDFYETQDVDSSKKEEKVEEGIPAVLPLVDVKAQIALRRNIFLTSAKKAMQALLFKLKLSQTLVTTDLQDLIKTFNLTANNIVFKPKEWNFITVVFLKLLSHKNNSVEEVFDTRNETLDLIVNELPSKHQFLECAVNLIKDLDVLLLENCETR